MAWMSDERYVYIQDCKDKKITARSARHTRTHCGKGGSVKFPSDYMSRKELKSMSSEVKTYNIGAPMTWKEFKNLPEDLMKEYILNLRERFEVPNKILAEHMGVCAQSFGQYTRALGLGVGKGRGTASKKWDRLEEFDKWWYGNSEAGEATEDTNEGETRILTPKTGDMTFEGRVDDIFRTIRSVIGNSNVKMAVYWDLMSEEDEK